MLIGANALVFVLQSLTRGGLDGLFALWPLQPIDGQSYFHFWQIITYAFLHSTDNITHLLFNMLGLWMFGADLERTWGTQRFLTYYFLCGGGAAICVIVANLFFGSLDTRTIGASGAIYGLLMAFGLLYPDRTVLFSFLFPIKAKYFVMILGAIAFLSSFGSNNGVSNVAHLGGMLFGYVYLRMKFRHVDWSYLGKQYQQWKLQRAKKKFQVYMRKHGPGPM